MSFLNCTCSQERNLSEIREESRPFEKRKDKIVWNMNSVRRFEPSSQSYELYATIGKGHLNTSTVSLAKHVASDTLVAVKKVNLEARDKEFPYLQNEIIMMHQLSHPHILPLHCTFIFQQELWSVTPLMAFGSCRDLIQAYFSSGLPEQAILFILRDVISALEYVHQQGIIHRSVKASHVLIGKSGHVCLTGFQNSCCTLQHGQRKQRIHDLPVEAVDCLHCYSPEMLEQNLAGYDFKSDVYSIGILICELANGQSPFADMPATQMLLEKLGGTNPKLADTSTIGEFIIEDGEDNMDQPGTPQERAEAIFFQRSFSKHLHNFAAACLQRDPTLRPTSCQLLTHMVFKNIKNKSSCCLPSLLHPVTPLTDIANAPKDSSHDEDIARQMSEISMQEDWTF